MVTSSVDGTMVVCVRTQVSIIINNQHLPSTGSYLEGFEDACRVRDHVLVGQHGAFGVSWKIQPTKPR